MNIKATGTKIALLSASALAICVNVAPSQAADAQPRHTMCSAVPTIPKLAPNQATYWPTSLADSNATGTVGVRVTIDANANVRSAAVDSTSGDFALDQEGRRLLSEAKFVASDDGCATIPGDYIVFVEFATK